MDGGGRLLGSVSGAGNLVLADSGLTALRFPALFHARGKAAPRARHKPIRSSVLSRSWIGMALIASVIGGSFLYASVLGGEYQTFVARNGAPLDLAAKLLGFEIDQIRIAGLNELTTDEVLKAADVSERNSLLFLDAADVRAKLRQVPLVRDVTVRKLFPNDLSFQIEERNAAGIWQKDGLLSVVASDGVAIDGVHDNRFNDLPFVVGPAANAHLAEFKALVDTAGDLRDRIKAGVYIGERRWTLQLDSGVELMLPEVDPKAALLRFATLERAGHLTDKDVISLDLRIPGRVTARLSEDAAAARAEMLAKRPKKATKE